LTELLVPSINGTGPGKSAAGTSDIFVNESENENYCAFVHENENENENFLKNENRIRTKINLSERIEINC
jgi:hypothetical protein